MYCIIFGENVTSTVAVRSKDDEMKFTFQVEDGEVILFAGTTSDGIKCFHYNGWHFVESRIESEDEAKSSRIKAMHFYEYRDKTVVGE